MKVFETDRIAKQLTDMTLALFRVYVLEIINNLRLFSVDFEKDTGLRTVVSVDVLCF